MNKYFAEFIGTFVLVSVILNFPSDNPIFALAVGLSLAVAIFLAGKFSGGHFNPAVSIAKYVQGEINSTDVILYPLAQIIGGLVAYLLHSGKTDLMKSKDDNLPSEVLLSDNVVNLGDELQESSGNAELPESSPLETEVPQGEVTGEVNVSAESDLAMDSNVGMQGQPDNVLASNEPGENQAGGLGLTLMDSLDNSPIYG